MHYLIFFIQGSHERCKIKTCLCEAYAYAIQHRTFICEKHNCIPHSMFGKWNKNTGAQLSIKADPRLSECGRAQYNTTTFLL